MAESVFAFSDSAPAASIAQRSRNALGTERHDFALRPPTPPVMIKETDGVNTVWIPPTETQWEQQVANPHPRAGTCFYANLRRKVWVRVDADGFPVVRTPHCPHLPHAQIHPSPGLD